MTQSIFGPKKDLIFMKKALALARKAREIDEVPIGALVVDEHGAIIGRGYNCVEKRHFQGAHAEIIALHKATKRTKDWRLEGCWLYVTLEPCLMCMGLIGLTRLAGVVYGSPSPLFGCHLDNQTYSPVYRRDALIVISGVCDSESSQLLKDFFRIKRKKKSG